MKVAPQDMYAAFSYAYRQRPDRRFVRAFDVLAERWDQLHGIEGSQQGFETGSVTSNGGEVHIPLLHGGTLVTEVTLPLPTTFPQLLSALDAWLAAMEGQERAAPLAPVRSLKEDKRLTAAVQMVNMVDPRFIAVGLSVLEKLWQEGRRDGQILKAAARGYAMLLMVLTPDFMESTDMFASEALAFLALARHRHPTLSLSREEALLAINMGYRADASSTIRGLSGSAPEKENEILDAYLRQDIAALRRLRDHEPGVLGYYLTARLYREIRLGQEAETAAWDLLQRYPNLYPSVIENIYAGDLNIAKMLTVLYPLDILGRLERQVSPASLEQLDSWLERLKGFSGEEVTGSISLAKFEASLTRWSPYEDERAYRFIIDEERLKPMYRVLYEDAVYLRFQLLFERWAVVEKADAYVNALASADRDHALVIFMQGQVGAELGDRRSADRLFGRVVSAPRTSGWLAYNAFYSLGNELDRIRLLSKVVGQLDGRPGHRLKMAWLFQYRIWNYDLAATCYASGLAQDPYQFWAYTQLARVRGSDEPLLSALERFPHSFQLLEEAGKYLADKSDRSSREKASYVLGLAQEIAPSRLSLTETRARVLTDLGRYEDALKVLNGWLDRYGKEGLAATTTRGQRAHVYVQMGQPDKALASLGEDVRSYQAGVMMVTARAHEDLGRIREAAEEYRSAATRYPTVGHVLAGTAAFFWRQGEDELAARMIAKGRPSEGPHSRWYFKDFLEVFEEAKDERIVRAVEALQRKGATNWEINALAWSLDGVGKTAAAFEILSRSKGRTMMASLENAVDLYCLLLKWKGREAATEYLHKAVPAKGRAQLMMVLYERGLLEVVLEEMGDPDSYPRVYREFMWLQMLIAWLGSDRKPADLAAPMTAHYRSTQRSLLNKVAGKILPSIVRRASHEFDQASRGYYLIGRYLLGRISRDELLAAISTNKQRCEFAYYIGLAERLKGNLAEATQWYHLCRETLLQNNGEFHWASMELFWWAHMGLDNRHRLLKDDMEAYHSREAQARSTRSGPTNI